MNGTKHSGRDADVEANATTPKKARWEAPKLYRLDANEAHKGKAKNPDMGGGQS